MSAAPMTQPNAFEQSVTPYLAVKGAAEAIEFYKRAFSARERHRIPTPDGGIGHAELIIGNSLVYLADEWAEGDFFSPATRGGPSVLIMLEVPDADAAFAQAVAAGAKVYRELRTEPYGRIGDVTDPFGHRWSIATANPSFKPEDIGGISAV